MHLAIVFSFTLLAPTYVQDRDGKDDVVGTIWHYTITHGNKKDSGQFRVYLKDIFKGKDKVGNIVPKDADETTLYFTDYKEFKGTAVLRRVKRNPVTWKGTLNRQNGTRWEMTVIIKDK